MYKDSLNTYTVKVTFKNDQVLTEQLNGYTEIMLDNKIWEYQNNELVKSYVVTNERGEKVA